MDSAEKEPDFAEISRQARRLVDARRAEHVLRQTAGSSSEAGPSKPTGRPAIRFTRTTTGCLACRKSKVKCDETTPVCLRCVASQRDCQYPTESPDGFTRKRRKRRVRQEGSYQQLEVQGRDTSFDTRSFEYDVFDAYQRDESLRDGDELALSGLLSLDPTVMSAAADARRTEAFPNGFRSNESTVSPTQPWPASSSISPKLLQDKEIGRSALLRRRKNRTTPVPGPSLAQPITRISIIETLLSAHAHDDLLYEFGPSHRFSTPHDLDPVPLPSSLESLTDAFPSPTALLLFHHFCTNTSKILVTMGNNGPNPILGLCTQQRLLDISSPAAAAMRMSMLSASVVHYVYETEQVGEHTPAGEKWDQYKVDLKEMSDKFKRAAVANIVLAAGGDTARESVDNLLAACTLLCIRDVISADSSWRDNLEFALGLINRKGGPQIMLGTEYSFTRRYLLENLATHDVFSCFITGKAPALLGNYDTWWFGSVEASRNKWEWESVERSFGVSRAMVDLIARITLLDSRKRRLGVSMKTPPREMEDAAEQVRRDCQVFLKELDIWGASLCAIPHHPRVTCGDYIHKYMATIFIMADILEQPPTGPQIDNAVGFVLELVSEASAMRMSVMLVWPLLIAGAFALPHRRGKVRELFSALKYDYCEDLVAAEEILAEQWRSIDQGRGKRPWIEVMRKVGREVLLI